jgi:hypothetical protein
MFYIVLRSLGYDLKRLLVSFLKNSIKYRSKDSGFLTRKGFTKFLLNLMPRAVKNSLLNCHAENLISQGVDSTLPFREI